MPYIGNPAVDRFTASKAASVYSGDGSTVAFTLEHSVGADEDILVSVDGVVQEPSVAYAVSSGTTLTFTAAPSTNAGNNIFVYYLFSTIGTVTHPATSALSATSGTFSTTLAATGNATVGGTLGVTGVLTGTSLDISGNIDVDGVTNLDVVDIDGAVDMASTLQVDGAITSSSTIAASRASADQNILGEATTAGYASRLQLKAANYSGGSYNGIQSFQGDAGAAWEISGAKQNATNIMKFTVGNTMAMEIQGNGFVTVPDQVHALFEKTSNTACGSGAVVFPLFNEQRINTGSSYNSTNGRFTAPVAGRYQFSVDFQCNGQYNQMHLGMYMNGGAIGNIDPWVNYGDSMRGANRSLTINLAAGDYLQAAVHFGSNSGTLEANRHRASFYLLG